MLRYSGLGCSFSSLTPEKPRDIHIDSALSIDLAALSIDLAITNDWGVAVLLGKGNPAQGPCIFGNAVANYGGDSGNHGF
jgi:hypothetical protein